jgi:hypothetical protein
LPGIDSGGGTNTLGFIDAAAPGEHGGQPTLSRSTQN